MFSLVYVSAASPLFKDTDLPEIIAVSQAQNAASKITGLLLHAGGNFMQVLEGPEDAVMKTFDRIAHDPRHRGVIVLRRERVGVRQFGEWSMALRSLTDVPADQRPNLMAAVERWQDSPSRPSLDAELQVIIGSFVRSMT